MRGGHRPLPVRLVLAGAALAATAFAAWAPVATATYPGDNGKLAFVSSNDSTSTSTGRISRVYVAKPDGSALREVASSPFGSSVGWSADGDRLVVCHAGPNGGRIHVMRPDGGGSRLVKRLSQPVFDCEFSPDRKLILYSSNARGRGEESLNDLFTIKADGTDVKRLTNGPDSLVEPTWSPNGRFIAFVRLRLAQSEDDAPDRSGIYRMRSDGSQKEQLTRFDTTIETYPDYSPSGSQIAYSGEGSDQVNDTGLGGISVMDADGSSVRRLTTNPLDFNPFFSPDGRQIAFIRPTGGTTLFDRLPVPDRGVFFFNRRNGAITAFAVNKGDETHGAWQPVGGLE